MATPDFIEIVETETPVVWLVGAFLIGALLVAGAIYALGKVVDNQDNGKDLDSRA